METRRLFLSVRHAEHGNRQARKKETESVFYRSKNIYCGKGKIWVIESNKRIVWIVGKRIDDRFKITDKTNKILKIIFIER